MLYLQQVVRHPGYDLRVFVLDGRVLGGDAAARAGGRLADQRLARRPGRALSTLPDEERLAIARRRGRRAADVAGVDLIADPDRDGPVVLEVNAVPGWRALSRVTGIDVAAAILDRFAWSRIMSVDRSNATDLPDGADLCPVPAGWPSSPASWR